MCKLHLRPWLRRVARVVLITFCWEQILWANPEFGVLSPPGTTSEISSSPNPDSTPNPQNIIAQTIEQLTSDHPFPATTEERLIDIASTLQAIFPESRDRLHSTQRFWQALQDWNLQAMRENLEGFIQFSKLISNQGGQFAETEGGAKRLLSKPLVLLVEFIKTENRYGFSESLMKEAVREEIVVPYAQEITEYLNSTSAVLVASGVQYQDIVAHSEGLSYQWWYWKTIESVRIELQEKDIPWTTSTREVAARLLNQEPIPELLEQFLEEVGLQQETSFFFDIVDKLEAKSEILQQAREIHGYIDYFLEAMGAKHPRQVEEGYWLMTEAILKVKNSYQSHHRMTSVPFREIERLMKEIYQAWMRSQSDPAEVLKLNTLIMELDSYRTDSESEAILLLAGFDLHHLRVNQEQVLKELPLIVEDADLLEHPLFGENTFPEEETPQRRAPNKIWQWLKAHKWVSIPLVALLIATGIIGMIWMIVVIEKGYFESQTISGAGTILKAPDGTDLDSAQKEPPDIQSPLSEEIPDPHTNPNAAWQEAKKMFERRIIEFKKSTPKRFEEDKFKVFNQKVPDPNERKKRYESFLRIINDSSLPTPSEILEAMRRVINPTGDLKDEDFLSILEEAMAHGFPQIAVSAWLNEGTSSQEAGVKTVIDGQEVILLNFPFLLSKEGYLEVLIHELWHGILQDEENSGPLFEGITELLTQLTLAELGVDYYKGSYLGEIFSTKILMELNEDQLTECYRGAQRHGISFKDFLERLTTDFFTDTTTRQKRDFAQYFKNTKQLKSSEFMERAQDYFRDHPELIHKLMYQMKRPQLLLQSFFVWRFADYNLLGVGQAKEALETLLIPGLVAKVNIYGKEGKHQKTDPITMWMIREVIAFSHYDIQQDQMDLVGAFKIVDELVAKEAIDQETARRWKDYLSKWRHGGVDHREGGGVGIKSGKMSQGEGKEGKVGQGISPPTDFPTSDESPLEQNALDTENKGGLPSQSNSPKDIPLEGEKQGKEKAQQKGKDEKGKGKKGKVAEEGKGKGKGTGEGEGETLSPEERDTLSRTLLEKWDKMIEAGIPEKYKNRSEEDLNKVLQELLDSRLRRWFDHLMQLPEGTEKEQEEALLPELLRYSTPAEKFSIETSQSASDSAIDKITYRYLTEYIPNLLKRGDPVRAYQLMQMVAERILDRDDNPYPLARATWIQLVIEKIGVWHQIRLSDETDNSWSTAFQSDSKRLGFWILQNEARSVSLLTKAIELAGSPSLFSHQQLKGVMQKMTAGQGIHSAFRVLTELVDRLRYDSLPGYYYEELKVHLERSKTDAESLPLHQKIQQVNAYYNAARLIWRHSGGDSDRDLAFQSALQNSAGTGNDSLSDFLASAQLTKEQRSQYLSQLKSQIKQGKYLELVWSAESTLTGLPDDVLQEIYPQIKDLLLSSAKDFVKSHPNLADDISALRILFLDKILDEEQSRETLFKWADQILKRVLNQAATKEDKLRATTGYLYMTTKQPENPNYSQRIQELLAQMKLEDLLQEHDWPTIERLLGPGVTTLWEALLAATLKQQDKASVYVDKIVPNLYQMAERLSDEKLNLQGEQKEREYYLMIPFVFGYRAEKGSLLENQIKTLRQWLKYQIKNGDLLPAKDYGSSLFTLLSQSRYLDREAFLEFWLLLEKRPWDVRLYDTPQSYESVFQFIQKWGLTELLPGVADCICRSLANKKPKEIWEFLIKVRELVPDSIRLEFETALYFQYGYDREWGWIQRGSESERGYVFRQLPKSFQIGSERWLREQIKTQEDAQRVKQQLIQLLKYETYEPDNVFSEFRFLEFPTEGLSLKTRFAAYLWAKRAEVMFLEKRSLGLPKALVKDKAWVDWLTISLSNRTMAFQDLNWRLETLASFHEGIRLTDKDLSEVLPSNGRIILDTLNLGIRHPSGWATLYLMLVSFVALWARYESQKPWKEFLKFSENIWNSVEKEGSSYKVYAPGFSGVADPEKIWQKFIKAAPKHLRGFFQRYNYLSTDQKRLFLTLLYAEHCLLQGSLGMSKETFRQELMNGVKRLLIQPEVKKALRNKKLAERIARVFGDWFPALIERHHAFNKVSVMLSILGSFQGYRITSRGLDVPPPVTEEDLWLLRSDLGHIFVRLVGGLEKLTQKASKGEGIVIHTKDLTGTIPAFRVHTQEGRIELDVFPIGSAAQTDTNLRRTLTQIQGALGAIVTAPTIREYTLEQIRDLLVRNGIDQVMVSSTPSYISIGYMTDQNVLMAGCTIEMDKILRVDEIVLGRTISDRTPFAAEGIQQIHIAQQTPVSRVRVIGQTDSVIRQEQTSEVTPESIYGKAKNIYLGVKKGLVNSVFTGAHPTVYQSPGVDYLDHRAYQPGDDIRKMNWKAYGKTDRLTVRTTTGEHRLTVMVVVDCIEQNLETAAEVFAVLGHSAVKNRDRIGLVLHKNGDHQYFVPWSIGEYVRFGIERILKANPRNDPMELGQTLAALDHELNERALVFLVTDKPIQQQQVRVPKKQELVAITIEKTSSEITVNPPSHFSVVNDPWTKDNVAIEFSQHDSQLEREQDAILQTSL